MSPFESEIEFLQRLIEHERSTVRCMKSVILRFPTSTGGELAEQILMEAKRATRDLEAKLEVQWTKHFEWLREVS